MSTMTKRDFLTISAYEAARTLPEAIRLNRDFMRHEREFCHKHFTDDPDETPGFTRTECLNGWEDFERILTDAERIWTEEMAAVMPRIAQRIREEVPGQDNHGDIADCVESGNYSPMAC